MTRWRSRVEDWSSKALACQKIVIGLQCLQHIWGYFKKQATAEERADFMLGIWETAWPSPARRSGSWNQTLLSAARIATFTRFNATRRSIDETLAPRLWLPKLPRPQLLGQHWNAVPFEAMVGARSTTVNLCLWLLPYRLYAYHRLIMRRRRRGPRSAQSGGEPTYCKTCPAYSELKRKAWTPLSISSIMRVTWKNA